MNYFNLYGLIIMLIIMIPNIFYACFVKEEKKYKNKCLELFEQIGRYGCFVLMIFNVPYTYTNFYFDYALEVYLIVNASLLTAYIVIWIFNFKKQNLFKAYFLSIIPTLIFVISAVLLGYILLMVFSIIFGICHILISVKNYTK